MLKQLNIQANETKIALIWGLLFTLTVSLCINLCNGNIIFTLDDPYIHLALAHNILMGVYGVNASEYSSPSSSIIWPFILVITEALKLGMLGPFLLNVAAALATAFIVMRLLVQVDLINFKTDRFFSWLLSILVIFITSIIALPMTGMEHSLHVFLVVIVLRGLISAVQNKAPSLTFLAAVIFMPLVRFEGIAFSVASVIGLWFMGYRISAIVTCALISTLLFTYFVFLNHIGLPLLPGSVLLKSSLVNTLYEHGKMGVEVGDASKLESVLLHLKFSRINSEAQTLILMGTIISIIACVQNKRHRSLIVYICVLVAIAGHLLFGQYGWFHRYEVYVIALSYLCILYGFSVHKPALNERHWFYVKTLILYLGLIAAKPYIEAAFMTPAASRNIFQQQYQMRRFAQYYYQRPIAVNDLGLVSYENKNFVLDLKGLGSNKVLKLITSNQYGAQQMAELVDEYNIGLIMIYRSWFPTLPKTWRKIAVLHTPVVTAAAGEVSFFITPKANVMNVYEALQQFKRTLPAPDVLEILYTDIATYSRSTI